MQGHDELWRNLGNGKFELTGRRVFPYTPWGAMGVKVLDWNGDGKLDLYVTDMHTDMSGTLEPGTEKKKHDPATMFPFSFLGTDGHHVLGNALFTNEGGGKFTEQSDLANVENGWPWGPSAADLNADGYPDLFVASGMNYPFRYSGNSVMLNEGGKKFADAEYVLGVEPRAHLAQPWFQLDCDSPRDSPQDICRGENQPVMIGDPDRPKSAPRHGLVTVWASRASRSAAIFDLDGDGDLDVVTCDYNDFPQVFHQRPGAEAHGACAHHQAGRQEVEPRRARRAGDGAGRRARAAAAERRQVRLPRAELDGALLRGSARRTTPTRWR